MIFAQLLPPGTQEAVTAIKPLVDHASTQGFQWHFELLFFMVLALFLFTQWSNWKRQEALAARLREVEDSHRGIALQFAQLQTRSVQAMEDVAAALREIKDTIHHK